MRTSFLIIIASGLLAATGTKWSEVWARRNLTVGGLYREAKAGRLRSSPYQRIANLGSLLLLIVGLFVALSGD